MTDIDIIKQIFDRASVRQHRDRAAAAYDGFAFLKDEIADRMAERLEEINRDFNIVLDLGAHKGVLGHRIKHDLLVSTDLSRNMVSACTGHRAVIDEEALPFKDASFDLVISNLVMHWVNDLPGALIQVNRALKPDGLFLGSIFGGETLKELRQSLVIAESEISSGVSPRISPFADVRDIGGLLQRAGFNLPVADSDVLTVSYEHPLKLMQDLRGMAEGNAVFARRKAFTSKAVMQRAAEIYGETYGDSDGRVPATFQIIYMTGWHPHESQQKPMKRGSAKMHLSDALEAARKD
jgi:NADH dehydrogenase [ubiquinone] 1 alpha subcomplex assembly factor 5